MASKVPLAAAVVAGALALAACAGPGRPAAQTAGQVKPQATAAVAAQPQRAPGVHVSTGSVDGSSGQVAVRMVDSMKFEPSDVANVAPGQKVTVSLTNAGHIVHNVYAPALGLSQPVRVNPGQTATATFTAPSQPGTYQFWCNESGHGEAGMIGVLVVR